MKKQEPTTEFSFSYAELEQLGDKAVDLISRDATELLPYGVDATFKQDLADLVQDVKDYPTDEELLDDTTTATTAKDTASDVLRTAIRGIMVRVKQVFGNNTAKYRRFGTQELDRLADSDLVRCGRRVSRMATKYLAPLAPTGVDAALIADLDVKTRTVDDAIDAQDAAQRERNTATQERVEMANQLYGTIVKLFDYGKDAWYSVNESKYNDYIIYGSQGGGQQSQVFTGMVQPMATVNVTSDISNASLVRIRNNGTVTFIVCAASIDTQACTVGKVVAPGEVSEGTGADFDPAFPFINITNNDPSAVASYELTVVGA